MSQKLLIVDDEAHIRMLIEQTLEELEDSDVEFLSADNGEKALEIINNEKTAFGIS
jgi:CheY-like chemotaxis protein